MVRLYTNQFIIYSLFVVIVTAYLTMALYNPVAYMWATYEDLIGEWAQWYCFLVALILSAKLAYSSASHRLFFSLLTVACFYVIMEEISWGQRLFGFTSPEFFQVHNLQRETNLHNFLTGPYNTVLKNFIEYTLATGLVFYGLVYPLTSKMNWKPAAWINLWIPPPPLALWPYFVTAAVLEIGLLSFNEAEIAELLIGLALVIMLIHYQFTANSRIHYQDYPPPERRNQRMRFMLVLFPSIIALLAAGTTYATYSIPHVRDKTDKRIQNGIKKFAGRYVRYEKWHTAEKLYQQYLKQKPNSTSILRKLALVYFEMGDIERFELTAQKAIDVDLARLAKRRDSVSRNLSMASSYELMDDYDNEKKYLDIAIRLAARNAGKNPENASSMYWLGTAHKQSGNLKQAARFYKKAHELRPTSSKYRKAYFKYRDIMEDSDEN